MVLSLSYIVKELIDTERDYIEDLRETIEVSFFLEILCIFVILFLQSYSQLTSAVLYRLLIFMSDHDY